MMIPTPEETWTLLCDGFFAAVLEEGTIRAGDTITLLTRGICHDKLRFSRDSG